MKLLTSSRSSPFNLILFHCLLLVHITLVFSLLTLRLVVSAICARLLVLVCITLVFSLLTLRPVFSAICARLLVLVHITLVFSLLTLRPVISSICARWLVLVLIASGSFLFLSPIGLEISFQGKSEKQPDSTTTPRVYKRNKKRETCNSCQH